MELQELAHILVFGSRWEDKLLFDPSFRDVNRGPALTDAPRFPGRPGPLSRLGKTEFPRELVSGASRARLLHFFANHELLAMELMAWALLRFPDAPAAFRAGLARTIADEQSHLKLYVQRMRELGMEFGELPVSDYFWNAMKDMRSPLEFVTQMSLTLEQANLDFSLHFQREVAQAGDSLTAGILERVHREEIEHVRHGLSWFNRWRAEDAGPGAPPEDDWDAYQRLLPPPMTPRRGKGHSFSAESRVKAGFSERFIREMEVCGGSKGRAPVFWLYNPHCDAEIVRGRPGFTPTEPSRRLKLDLEHLPMHLALETDVVLVEELPDSSWLKEMRDIGFTVPEFRLRSSVDPLPRDTKIAGLQPWGWSPEPFERFRAWRPRLSPAAGANATWCGRLLSHATFADSGLGELFSKVWSSAFLRRWLLEHPEAEPHLGSPEDCGAAVDSWPEAERMLRAALLSGRSCVVKAPWGTSGMQNKRVLRTDELEGPLGGWMRNTLGAQGALVVEPWLDKLADLSLQIEVLEDGVRMIGIRQFLTGDQQEYRGTWLDPRLSGLPTPVLRFLHSGALDSWHRLARELGAELRKRGYLGPAGLDALVYRLADGSLRLKPLVELNPRWTMGRVAIELERHVVAGVPALWAWMPAADPSATAREWLALHPPRFSRSRLEEGIVFTNDPFRARSLLTAIATGDSAGALLAALEPGPAGSRAGAR
jgi:uncharacterized ferritin-like protein (DUF455 family)